MVEGLNWKYVCGCACSYKKEEVRKGTNKIRKIRYCVSLAVLRSFRPSVGRSLPWCARPGATMASLGTRSRQISSNDHSTLVFLRCICSSSATE